MTKEEMIAAIKDMTVLELAELVKALEEEFGISAAPVAVAGPAVAAPGAVAAVTIGAQPLKRHSSMTVTTTIVFVKPSQRPARAGVTEQLWLRLVFRPVAALASTSRPGG